MWQELAISSTHSIPIHTVHIYVVETLLLLLINMVEHCFTLCSQVHFKVSGVGNRSKLARCSVHLLHASTKEEDVLAILAHFKVSITYILVGQLHILLAEVEFPKVHTTFKRSGVIKIFALLVDDSIAQ